MLICCYSLINCFGRKTDLCNRCKINDYGVKLKVLFSPVTINWMIDVVILNVPGLSQLELQQHHMLKRATAEHLSLSMRGHTSHKSFWPFFSIKHIPYILLLQAYFSTHTYFHSHSHIFTLLHIYILYSPYIHFSSYIYFHSHMHKLILSSQISLFTIYLLISLLHI